jgi:hypothetical protein
MECTGRWSSNGAADFHAVLDLQRRVTTEIRVRIGFAAVMNDGKADRSALGLALAN